MPIRRHTVMQSAIELIPRPAANAGLGIRRDVGGIDRAESSRERHTAAESWFVGGAVTVCAIAQHRQIGAPRNRVVGPRGHRGKKSRGQKNQ